MDLHLEQLTRQYVSDGLDEREARIMARREFGPVDLLKEQCRDTRRVRLLEDCARDLAHTLRLMAKSSGFTATAVLSLALGIGANAAIFTLLNAVIVRPLPVAAPQRLVQFTTTLSLWETGANSRSWFAYPLFDYFRKHAHSLAGIFGGTGLGRVNVGYRGSAGVAQAEAYDGDFFSVLGTAPQYGRLFSATDDQPGTSVAVISDRYWRNRFSGDPSIVGSVITVNQIPFTVIGVTAQEFTGIAIGSYPDVWVPLRALDRLRPDPKRWTNAFVGSMTVGGRLRPDVSRQQAQAELDVLQRQFLTEQLPLSELRGWENAQRYARESRLLLLPAATGMESGLRDRYALPLKVLMGVAGIVLLVACANIANLLLARASNRSRELALRRALGAGRGRLVRQLLTESIVLALAGGTLAVPMAWWGSFALVGVISTGDSRVPLAVEPDWQVFAFTCAVSLITGILFGLVPAFRGTRVDPGAVMKEGMRNAGRSSHTPERVLIVVQVALSVVLVTGAGLFVRTLQQLWSINVGYDRENVLMLSVDARLAGYSSQRADAVYREILRRLQALPDVKSAAASIVRPVDDQFNLVDRVDEVDGRRLPETSVIRTAWNATSPGYFSTIATPVLAGRDFDPRDTVGAPAVVIVNESLAHSAFPNQNAIGHRLGLATIVGVVCDSPYRGLRDGPSPVLYRPLSQYGPAQAYQWGYVSFEIRHGSNPGLLDAIRREVASVDRNLPVFRTRTLLAQTEQSLVKERLLAMLSTVFGTLALLIACVGLSGLMAYAVACRTPEIGIRLALGAGRDQILWLVLRETLWLACAGIAAGVGLALWVARYARSLLFGVDAADPLTIGFTVVILIGVAALAAYVPARRALRVDPVVALRCE
jgi:predicted permease